MKLSKHKSRVEVLNALRFVQQAEGTLKNCAVSVNLDARALPGKCCVYLFKFKERHRQPLEGRGRRCHFPRGGQRALLLHPASASLERGAAGNPRENRVEARCFKPLNRQLSTRAQSYST